MFDKDTNNRQPIKTTGILTLFDSSIQFDLSQMTVSGLEQLILILNSMKREADALSNDGKGGSRVIIAGFFLNDWIDDAMAIYNSALKLISVASDKEYNKESK